MRRRIFLAVLSAGLTLHAFASASAADTSLDSRRANLVAQVLAGIQPPAGDPDIDRLVKLPAFAEHHKWMSEHWSQVRERLGPMEAWGAREIRLADVQNRTLLYPFSGPDFLNAYALFPNDPEYIFFSLEKPGSLPDLSNLSATQFEQLLRDVRAAFRDIFERNYFITDYMSRQLTTPWVHGTVPVMATMMALMNVRIVHIEPIDLFPELTRAYEAPGAKHPRRIMRAVRIEFVKANGGPVQRLTYVAVDATDRQLAYYPGFLDWVAKHHPAAAMMKSASYLLDDPQFSKTRDMILSTADFVLQDDTGIPYKYLAKSPWRVKLYGHYLRPTIKGLRYGYQADLESA